MTSSLKSSHKVLAVAAKKGDDCIDHDVDSDSDNNDTSDGLRALVPSLVFIAKAEETTATERPRNATTITAATTEKAKATRTRLRGARTQTKHLMTKLSEAFGANRLRREAKLRLLLLTFASLTLLIKLSLASPEEMRQPNQQPLAQWQQHHQFPHYHHHHQQQQQQERQQEQQQQQNRMIQPSASVQIQSDRHQAHSSADLPALALTLSRHLQQQRHQQQQSLAHLLHSSAAQVAADQRQHWTSGADFAQPSLSVASFEQPSTRGEKRELTSDNNRLNKFIPYRAVSPTAPSVNRQLIAPPPFYEIGLTPTKALQIESNEGPRDIFGLASEPLGSSASRSLLDSEYLAASSGSLGLVESEATAPGGAAGRGNRGGATATPAGVVSGKSNGQNGEPLSHHQDDSMKETLTAEASSVVSSPVKPQDQRESSNDSSSNEKSSNGGISQDYSSNNEQIALSSANMAVDRGIEPRQRRRMFNRILKKAEWNHLFVELSKVFLRYFLDLALKDIIGKQSGAAADTTTSRKKLDAQSELTDLLKDFVKTAISNI